MSDSETTDSHVFNLTVRLRLLEQRVDADYHEILESATDLHFRLDVIQATMQELHAQIYLLRFLVNHLLSRADTTDAQSEPVDLESLD